MNLLFFLYLNTKIQMTALFDNLLEKLKKRKPIEITNQYMNELKNCLNILDFKQAEQVIVLIIHGYLMITKNNVFVKENLSKNGRLPYSMKFGPGGKGLSLTLDQMTPDMKLLLGEYCLLNEGY